MRHLKLFQEGFETEDFYRKVDRYEYHQKVGSDTDNSNNRIEFDKTDIGSLDEMFIDSDFKYRISKGTTNNQNHENHDYTYLKIWKMTTKVESEFFIFKVPDDYFIVYWSKETESSRKGTIKDNQYYICDQINGVIKLLIDKEIIKDLRKEEE